MKRPVAADQGGGGRRHPRRARRAARARRRSSTVCAAIGAGSVLAALGLGLLTTVASAARWCLVARGLGLRLPLAAAVSDCYRALFLNSVLPAGVLGDVHRAVGYGRQIGDVGRGVRVVALERVTGQLAIIVVGLGGAGRVAAGPARDPAAGPRAARPSCSRPSPCSPPRSLWAARAPRAARIRGALRSARRRRALRCPVPVDVAGPAGAVGGRAGRLPRPVRRRRPGRRHAGDACSSCFRCWCWACLRWRCRSTSEAGARARRSTAVAFGAVGLGAAQGLTTAVVYGVLGLIACLPGAVVLLLPAVLARYRQVRYRHHLPAARPAMSVQLERSPA